LDRLRRLEQIIVIDLSVAQWISQRAKGAGKQSPYTVLFPLGVVPECVRTEPPERSRSP
jgi:hypothetical protein